jgi:hypothetical protein
MATFLVTAKMNPALRARVEKSVHGGRATSPLTMRRIISLARFALVFAVAFGIYTAVTNRRRERRELEKARTELVELARAQTASLDPRDVAAVSRAESWLGRVSSSDFGEVVADEIRAPDALTTRLSQPLVYVRGPLDGFKTTAKLAETAVVSPKDSLLLCLLDPPSARTEKVLLEKVRLAYLGGAGMDAQTLNVRRLHEAVVGLPFLMPAWSDRVRAAAERSEVVQLRRDFERAPIERAKFAAKAGLFLVALDEPGDGSGPTELDGERAHFVRVALVDVGASKILVSTRRRVDPSWIGSAKKPTHAMGLDSCALAFDIHESVRKK